MKSSYLGIILPVAAVWACTTVAVAGQSASPQPDAPVPPALRAAKTAFVSNAGSDSGLFPEPFSGDPARPYAEFYNDLKTTGQLELVDDPSAADLILEIRLVAPSGPSNPQKQKGASDPLPMLRLVAYDRRSHYILWTCTESVEEAFLQKTHDRNLDEAISRLTADFETVRHPPAPGP